MPRFAKGEFSRMQSAMGEAYESGSLGPIEEYSSRQGGSIPKWARRELEIAAENIRITYREGGEREGQLDEFRRLSVPLGSRIVDALVNIGAPGFRTTRTARVHIEGWMSDDDVIGRVRQIVQEWIARSGEDEESEAQIIDFWRVM